MIVYMALVCDCDMLSVKVFYKSTPAPLCSTLPAMFPDRFNHSSAVCGLGSAFFFFILQHSVLFVLVVLYVLSYPAAPSPPLSPLPSPPLSKHLWAAAGLFCATP